MISSYPLTEQFHFQEFILQIYKYKLKTGIRIFVVALFKIGNPQKQPREPSEINWGRRVECRQHLLQALLPLKRCKSFPAPPHLMPPNTASSQERKKHEQARGRRLNNEL